MPRVILPTLVSACGISPCDFTLQRERLGADRCDLPPPQRVSQLVFSAFLITFINTAENDRKLRITFINTAANVQADPQHPRTPTRWVYMSRHLNTKKNAARPPSLPPACGGCHAP